MEPKTPSKHHHHDPTTTLSSSEPENLNPNTPSLKSSSNSKSHNKKSSSKKNNPVAVTVHSPPPHNRIRRRKFLVAKKNNPTKTKPHQTVSFHCKCKDKGEGNGSTKCLCVAYENLRASQEEFFKNPQLQGKACDEEDEAEKALDEVIESSLMVQHLGVHDGNGEERGMDDDDEDGDVLEGSSNVKRRRDKLLEVARNSVPESGSGGVMHLVMAFEKLLSIPKSKEKDQKEEENGENNYKSKVMKWALPGLQLQQPPKAPETEVEVSESSSFCYPSELVLTSENLGLDSTISVSSSWDSCRGSVSSRTSSGGRRSRRNSLESSGTFGGRRWKKKQQLKVTSQKPFRLRTEQRGKLKEEEFMKKVQEMMAEEEKLRVPIAQGLPWTTDEPECLVKPPVKESTRPIDVKLHSDVRAIDRSEFDHQVAEKMSFIEQLKLERERQQKVQFSPVKESTRPIDLKLHSDVRAIDRAEFDHQVAEKMSFIEQLKLERERQQKLKEEEEIRRLRKELIPKAQPMPYFDRPFVPRRSSKHPTIPREHKFHIPHHKDQVLHVME